MTARRLAFALALALASVAVLALLSACTSAPTDSGIIGTVTIGPTEPVATQGSTNSQPYSAELQIAPKGGTHLKRPTIVTSAADGTFKVNLAPGTYVIQAAGTQGGPPTLAPITVVVEPNTFAEVEVAFDSGIR